MLDAIDEDLSNSDVLVLKILVLDVFVPLLPLPEVTWVLMWIYPIVLSFYLIKTWTPFLLLH